MFESLVDAIGVFVEILRRNPRARAWTLGISLAAMLLGIGLGVLSLFIGPVELKNPAEAVAVILGVGFGFVFLLAVLSYSGVRIKGGGTITIELEKLREERQTIQERLAERPKPDVIDTIQLNLNQLSEYYVINKSQARTSFGFSVFAIVAGLITIVGGIWLFYFQESPNVQLTAISAISGVLIEFVGAAYFCVYRKSLEQLNFFFEQLVRMQDTMLSVRLCEQVAPEARQMQLRERIILTLLQRSSQGVTFPVLADEPANPGVQPTPASGRG